MAIKYVFANQKGGVTKSTTSVNAAVMASLSKKRVLLVDMDGQGNSTYGLGYHPDALSHTVYTTMKETSTLSQTILPTYFDPSSGVFFHPHDEQTMQSLGIASLAEARRGPDLLPNNILASSADIELNEDPNWGVLLRQRLAEIEARYDEIYIDTNPALGKMTIISLFSADYAVIPMTPETWSTQGMLALIRSVARAQKAYQLRIAGILFTRVKYASHTSVIHSVRNELLPQINQQYPTLTLSSFDTLIHEGAPYGEAAINRTNVILSAPYSNFALEYWRFYRELLSRSGGQGLQAAEENYNRLHTLNQEEQEKKQARRQQVRSTTGRNE